MAVGCFHYSNVWSDGCLCVFSPSDSQLTPFPPPPPPPLSFVSPCLLFPSPSPLYPKLSCLLILPPRPVKSSKSESIEVVDSPEEEGEGVEHRRPEGESQGGAASATTNYQEGSHSQGSNSSSSPDTESLVMVNIDVRPLHRPIVLIFKLQKAIKVDFII